jgi:hypothetical protein
LLANLTGGAIEVELEALTAPFDTAVMDARSLQGRADAKQAWRFERQRAHARRVKLDAYAVACLLRRQ